PCDYRIVPPIITATFHNQRLGIIGLCSRSATDALQAAERRYAAVRTSANEDREGGFKPKCNSGVNV
ncbi:hypothetical protein, partial [Caballeronia telluris]|uniref:hypothetical protein n=1 Tax=Caballeronia telluris TaxID=326475 RepID=UPI001F37A5C9